MCSVFLSCSDWWCQAIQYAVNVPCLTRQVLVDELREKCLREERQDLTGSSTSSSSYSSLTTAPDDWKLDEARPCSGERLLLMFDR